MPEITLDSHLQVDNSVLIRQAAEAVYNALSQRLTVEEAARASGDAALRTDVDTALSDIAALQAAVDTLNTIKLSADKWEESFRTWLDKPETQRLLTGSTMIVGGQTMRVTDVVARLLSAPQVVKWGYGYGSDVLPDTVTMTLSTGEVSVAVGARTQVQAADAVAGVLERVRYDYTAANFAGQPASSSVLVELSPVMMGGIKLFDNPRIIERTGIRYDLLSGIGATTAPVAPLIDVTGDGYMASAQTLASAQAAVTSATALLSLADANKQTAQTAFTAAHDAALAAAAAQQAAQDALAAGTGDQQAVDDATAAAAAAADALATAAADLSTANDAYASAQAALASAQAALDALRA